MSKIALDLKNFKHVKSDDKSTVLRHKDGHDLTISHKSLSKEAKAQLDALSKAGSRLETDVQQRERKNENDNTPRFQEGGRVRMPASVNEDPVLNKNKEQMVQKNQAQVIAEDPKKRWEHFKQQITHPLTKPQKKAEGGEVENCYADGGEVAEPVKDAFWSDAEELLKMQPKKMMAEGGEAVQPPEEAKAGFLDSVKNFISKYSDPAEIGSGIVRMGKEAVPAVIEGIKESPYGQAVKFGAGMLKGAADESGVTARLNAPEPQAAAPVAAQPAVVMEQPQVVQQLAPQPVMEAPPTPAPTPVNGVMVPEVSLQGAENLFRQGAAQEQAGVIGAANAAGEIAKAQADEQAKAAAHLRDMETDFRARQQETELDLAIQRRAIQEGKIDPERYWKGDPRTGEGGHSKIAAGIGMILAGFNPSNQPNAAINFLNTQIDKNIQAQQKNLDSDHNLYKALMDQYNNRTIATQTMKILATDALAKQIESAAATSKNELARQNGMAAAGKLMQQNANTAKELAQFKMLMGAMGSGNASMIRALGHPEMAKDLEEKIVPGVGKASRAVPPDVREHMVNHQKFDAGIDDLENFLKTRSKLSPSDYIALEQKTEDLKTYIRENKLGGVYKEGEKPLLDKFLKASGTGILDFVTNRQLQELKNANHRNFNILKSSFGLPVDVAAQHSGPSEGQVRSLPNGQKFILKGTHWVPLK